MNSTASIFDKVPFWYRVLVVVSIIGFIARMISLRFQPESGLSDLILPGILVIGSIVFAISNRTSN